MNIVDMTQPVLLEFETVPLRVALEGFGKNFLGEVRAFMTRVAEGDSGAAYRVVVEGRRAAARSRTSITAPQRRPFRRHLSQEGEDVIVMPGCRVRLAPGRPKAVVEFRSDAGAFGGLVLATLLETALTHALATSGFVVNHAAAFEVEGRSILAVGPTHAGKSTLAGAVLAAGGSVVSDDSVILSTDGKGVPQVGALRRNLWLREGSVGLLPKELRRGLIEIDAFGENRWGLERDSHPACFRPEVRPDAIVLLRRDRRMKGFRIQEISSADGLVGLILASSSLYLSSRYPIEQKACMESLTALVNSAPCFSVRMGTRLVDNPRGTVDRLAKAVGS